MFFLSYTEAILLTNAWNEQTNIKRARTELKVISGLSEHWDTFYKAQRPKINSILEAWLSKDLSVSLEKKMKWPVQVVPKTFATTSQYLILHRSWIFCQGREGSGGIFISSGPSSGLDHGSKSLK